jgi:hypothetical protein
MYYGVAIPESFSDGSSSSNNRMCALPSLELGSKYHFKFMHFQILIPATSTNALVADFCLTVRPYSRPKSPRPFPSVPVPSILLFKSTAFQIYYVSIPSAHKFPNFNIVNVISAFDRTAPGRIKILFTSSPNSVGTVVPNASKIRT